MVPLAVFCLFDLKDAENLLQYHNEYWLFLQSASLSLAVSVAPLTDEDESPEYAQRRSNDVGS